VTPFGAKLRALRAERNVTLTDMANTLGVSPSYLSALERGKRSRPSWAFVQAAIQYFNIIWDEAEELQRLADISTPKPTLDSSGLTPRATELANRLAAMLRRLDPDQIEKLHAILDRAAAKEMRDAAKRGREAAPRRRA